MRGRARLRFTQQMSHIIMRQTNISAIENHHMSKPAHSLTKAKAWGISWVDVSPVAALSAASVISEGWAGLTPRNRRCSKSGDDSPEKPDVKVAGVVLICPPGSTYSTESIVHGWY